MRTHFFEGLDLHRCPVCAGLWLEPGERHALMTNLGDFSELIPKTTPPAIEATSATAERCPGCDCELHDFQVREDVWTLRCDSCGGDFLPASDLIKAAENRDPDLLRVAEEAAFWTPWSAAPFVALTVINWIRAIFCKQHRKSPSERRER